MYKALRSMKVKGADGQYRIVKPGDAVPEAAEWRNLRSYLEAGHVVLATHPSPAPRKAPVKATPKMSTPLPTPPAEAQPVPELDIDSSRSKPTKSSLSDMTLTDLREIAGGLGIDSDMKKSGLVKAILKAQ